jgi:RimJ/RimL family protein N-acetyltransferase
MKFKIDLTNYSITELPSYIIEVDNISIILDKLLEEINQFNLELKWDGMWSVTEAENRLIDGWKLIVFNSNDKIKGWYWLDKIGVSRNLYINKEYRNRGIGREMNLALFNICKKVNMNEIVCYIDDWNISSIKCIENSGWSRVIE